jgi:hypothetical protein
MQLDPAVSVDGLIGAGVKSGHRLEFVEVVSAGDVDAWVPAREVFGDSGRDQGWRFYPDEPSAA